MLGGYETTLNYQLPPQLLRAVMDEAVDRYLASHHTVFPIERQNSSIELKVQKSRLSKGETIVIAIKSDRLYVASEYIEEPSPFTVSWIKNRHNVMTLATCVANAAQELNYSLV